MICRYLIALIMFFGSCASSPFPYRFYGLDGADFSSGILIGSNPTHDLAFKVCAPHAQTGERTCIVMRLEDFQLLRSDFIECRNTLKDLEELHR